MVRRGVNIWRQGVYLLSERPLSRHGSYHRRATLTEEMDLLAVLQHDIAARLQPVCGAMAQSDFDKLVCDIAAVKLKYGVEAELSAAFRQRLTAAVNEKQTSGSQQRA